MPHPIYDELISKLYAVDPRDRCEATWVMNKGHFRALWVAAWPEIDPDSYESEGDEQTRIQKALNEDAWMYGLVEPTAEERAEAERSRAAFERQRAEQGTRTAAFRAALATVTDPIARTVLDLHAEQDGVAWTTCAGCDTDGYDAESPPWPCRTIDAVAEALGIEVPS